MISMLWISISVVILLLICIVSASLWYRHQRGIRHQLQRHNLLLSEQNILMNRKMAELSEQLTCLLMAMREQVLQQKKQK